MVSNWAIWSTTCNTVIDNLDRHSIYRADPSSMATKHNQRSSEEDSVSPQDSASQVVIIWPAHVSSRAQRIATRAKLRKREALVHRKTGSAREGTKRDACDGDMRKQKDGSRNGSVRSWELKERKQMWRMKPTHQVEVEEAGRKTPALPATTTAPPATLSLLPPLSAAAETDATAANAKM